MKEKTPLFDATNRNTTQKKKALSLFFAFLLLFSLSGCAFWGMQTGEKTNPLPASSVSPVPSTPAEDAIPSPLPPLTLTVVDVGHGDCLLVEGEGKTMVIDTGEADARKQVRQALTSRGISVIDILLITHPHSDHMGNATYLLEQYPVKEVYMTGREHTTAIFRNFLTALEERPQIPVTQIAKGGSLSFAGGVFSFLGPLSLEEKDLNATSAVIRLTYGNTSMLLAGDLPDFTEPEYVKTYGENLKADLLKIGHHATDSTTEAFARCIRPSIAVVSMRPLSDYGKAEQTRKQAIFSMLETHFSTKVYRTDSHGNVSVTSDGLSLSVSTQKP